MSEWWGVSFLVLISDPGHSCSNRTREKWSPASSQLLLPDATEGSACSVVVCSAPILPRADIPKRTCWPPEEKYNARGICPSDVRGRPANINWISCPAKFHHSEKQQINVILGNSDFFVFVFGGGSGEEAGCYTAVANWYLSGLSVKHQQTTNRKLIFLEIITVFYSKSKWKWGFILCTGLDLLAFKWISENLSYTSAVPNLCGTKDQFHGRPFFHGWVGNGFGMIQAHCIYCALYFYYYYISSTFEHQALDPGVADPL